MSKAPSAFLVRITGRVQGVGFRMWTQEEAERLGLRGWVRNERDGSVTAMIAGSGEATAIMLKLLWTGPRGAVVSNVDAKAASAEAAPASFEITG
ncbi:acylphosphatase [Mesorhizobium sp. CGMCC 1.15528]|uniref:Acylphosphatase n=1 Tax=Mesorhizobium zhangyense TaxID=1776730 RepID=A0A7C9V9U6_9HYPH|nr:acylphosphatase [Mesorhizobium zhangyense]NGN44084.1 acylphosphatase [Mesorhizobium zhangyense]